METLCKIRDIYRAVAQVESQMEKMYGLGLNEGMILCTLKKCGKLSSGEIAEKLGLTTSNTSKVIRSVERKGFVERVSGEEDKRQMYFTLTDRGGWVLRNIKTEELLLPEPLREMLS
jgi:DNA-binding MarR family transcriptional regulator